MVLLRNIGALFAGLLVGAVVNMALVLANLAIFPMPEGLDMADSAAFGAWAATLPAAAFILPLFAHLGQAFTAAFLAARLAGSRPMLLAMIVGAISLLAGISNAMQIPMPAWMYVEFPLYLVVAWAGGTLATRGRLR